MNEITQTNKKNEKPLRATLILAFAILLQIGITFYYYGPKNQRLAGIDYLSYFCPQTLTVMVDYGIAPERSIQDLAKQLTEYKNFIPVMSPYYLDFGYLVCVPFVLLPLKLGLGLFLLTNFFLFLLGGKMILDRSDAKISRSINMIVVAILAVSAPIFYNLLHSHTGGIFFFVIVASILLSDKRPFLGGVLFSLLILHKVYFFPIIVLIFAARHYRFVAGVVISTIVFALIDPHHVFGFNGLSRTYETYFSHGTGVEDPIFLFQLGSRELFYRLFHGGSNVATLFRSDLLATGSYVVFGGSVFLRSLYVLWKGRNDQGGPSLEAWSICVATLCLVSPSMGNYNLIYAVFPLLVTGCALYRIFGNSSLGEIRTVVSLFIVSAVFLLGNFLFLRYPDTFGGKLPPFPNVEWIGMVIIWGLSIWVFQRRQHSP